MLTSPIWTKEHGWSLRFAPYLTYGAVIGAANTIIRVLNPNDSMFGNPLAGLLPILACIFISLIGWLLVLASDRIFRSGERTALKQVAERNKSYP